MPFELNEKTTATLRSVTPRVEKHGDDDVIALTMGVTITTANTILDKFSPKLRHTLYKPTDTETLPGVEVSTPLLRTALIETVNLKGTLQGWTLRVDHGINEDEPITIGDCKVDDFKVSPSEGGSVDLSFRIGSSDVDDREIGIICGKLRQDIVFTLTAPQEKKPEEGRTDATGAEIDGTVAAFKADNPDATDLFVAGAPGPDDQGTGADDEGSDPDAGQADPGAAEQAEIEAGMRESLAKAGVKPRRGRVAA